MSISKDIANIIVDPYAYADWDKIHGAFTSLRKTAPLAIAKADGFAPFWAVTKFDDIQTIEKQNDLFRSAEKPFSLVPESLMDPQEESIKTLVAMDNPDHRKHRILTQGWFMPANLRKLEDRVRAIAKEFVEHMLSFDGECDFAREVAFLYPLRVVMEVIGVPKEDEARMLKLTQEMFGIDDPELNRSADNSAITPEEREKQMLAVGKDFMDYFTALSEDRRANPRLDLASVIANAQVDDKPIGFAEEMGYYIIAATAGHDTTSASTASAGWELAKRPELLSKIKADNTLVSGLVEESIRWETPVKHFMRTAMEDTVVSGQNISKGDWLMLCYASGNRDEDKFANPFEFDITRQPNKHVAFGYGAHVCLGQHLARMEMRLLWEELLPKLESLEMNGVPKRMISNFVCGPKNVPIRFKTA